MIPATIYVPGVGQQPIESTCEYHGALISLIPVPPPPLRPNTLPLPPSRDASGYAAHLVVSMTGTSRNFNNVITFGSDSGTFRLRKGWTVKLAGGAGEWYVVHNAREEPLPFQQRFELTVVAPSAGLIVPPAFGADQPAPYTHLRVVRGIVQDEDGNSLPLNVDVPFASFLANRHAMYQFVVEV